MIISRSVVVLALLVLACVEQGPPLPGDYPLARFNGSSVPSIYHATLECDELIEAGNLRITDTDILLSLTLRRDCRRSGGSNPLVVWPFSSTGVYADGTIAVTLRSRTDTVRLVGTYHGTVIELASEGEVFPSLSGTFTFGPPSPLQ